jgi:hypothetical protein
MEQSPLFLSRRGREASIEYEPCWPGKGFLLHRTGLYRVHFLSSIYTGCIPCRSSCQGLTVPRDIKRHNVYFRRDLALWLERLTANAEVATVLGSIPASSDTVFRGAAGEAVLNTAQRRKNPKNTPVYCFPVINQPNNHDDNRAG